MLSNLTLLFTGEWWKQTYGALFRTLIAGLAPFLLAYSNGQPQDWRVVASQVGLLLIMAALSSLKGIPVPNGASYWEVLGARFLRQFAQFLIAGIGTAVYFTEVPWWAVLVGATTSALSTVLIGSLYLLPGQHTETQEEVEVVVVDPEPAEAQVDPGDEEADPSNYFTDDEPSAEEEDAALAAESGGERFV